MKKSVLILMILVCISFLIINISAQQDNLPPQPNIPKLPGIAEINPETGSPVVVEKITEAGDSLNKTEVTKEFMSDRLKEFLEKNKDNIFIKLILLLKQTFGLFFSLINAMLKGLSPLIKIFVGVGYSFSGHFLIALVFWITIVIITHSPLKNLFETSEGPALIIAIIVPAIAANIKVIEGTNIINYISGSINSLIFRSTSISNLIVLLLFVLLMILLNYFYDQIMQNLNKENEEEELEKNKNEIKIFGRSLRRSRGEK